MLPSTETAVTKQRTVALAKSEAVRTEQAYYRRGLRSGELTLGQVLAEDPEVLHIRSVAEIVSWCPKIEVGGRASDQAMDRRVRLARINQRLLTLHGINMLLPLARIPMHRRHLIVDAVDRLVHPGAWA